jgi:poly-gamma-glutamate synthesis protein (capsule biosynthesis protein)
MKLLFVGDVMLGRLINEVLRQKPAGYPWGDTLPFFRDSDFRVINLECVISDHGRPWSAMPKAFHFRTDAKNIESLKVASIDTVSLANNHTLDYEYEAMFEALKILKKANISYAGAGVNLREASSTTVTKVGGKKIGLVAFTDNEPAWEARQDQAGVYFVPIDLKDARAKRLFETIRKAKKEVDFLIVSAHWGPNWGYAPPKEHPPFARALVDADADVIFGHSGHVFRGIEIYKGKPIIYCAGDFVDDYAVDEIEKNDQSFIFVLEIDENRTRQIKMYPTVIRDFQARMAKGREMEEIVQKMSQLCNEFGTEANWQEKEKHLEINIASH